MAKLSTAQPRIKTLVANLAGGGDPSIGVNPVKIRTGFVQQYAPEISRALGSLREEEPSSPGLTTYKGLISWTSGTLPVGATGTITVIQNDFTDAAVLSLGPYTVTSNVDFTPGGSLALTATALAAAITALPDFNASALDNVITVTGPFGLDGDNQVFEALFTGAFKNYTLSTTEGYLVGSEPYLGPMEILP